MTRDEWNKWKDENRGDYGALINLARDNGADSAVDELISSSDLDERVKAEAEDGWERVACFLESIIHNKCYEYYRIDVYQNADVPEDWDCYAEEVENQLDFDEYCCDVCGEDTDTLYGIEEWIEEEEEENFSDELLKVLRDYDDYFDRCPKCWEKLKKQAAFFINNKEKFESAEIDFSSFVDNEEVPEGLTDPTKE